jgi:hypothetical protein
MVNAKICCIEDTRFRVTVSDMIEILEHRVIGRFDYIYRECLPDTWRLLVHRLLDW